MLISRSDRGILAQWWFTVDKPLLWAVLFLMAIGVLVGMAASPPVAERIGVDTFHFIRSQLMFLSVAAPLFVMLSFVSIVWIRRISLAGFLGFFALMIAALFFGPEIKGAHRWIDIGRFSLQPSELAKPFFVVTVSWFLAEAVRRPDMPANKIAHGIALAMIGVLILQPDIGQTLLVTATFGAMLLVAGLHWFIVIGLISIAAAGLGAAYAFVPHVTSRIDRFLDPEKGDTFQIDTALSAFRDGGLMGTGPGGGEAKLVLPDAHTDFSFSVIGEEFGIIACIGLIIIFMFIVLRVLNRAKSEPDPFAALALTGLITMTGLQAFINMGVNTALLPSKGMTLPFISYGGSSLLGTAMAMGLVLSLARKRSAAEILSGPTNLVPA
jgi:cell division protein FtsW